MMLSLTVMVVSASMVQCHEYYSGKCPDFSPMGDFDWGRFSGDWWAALKMNSRSSCIRYNYDLEDGDRVVTETKLLPVIGRFGVPSAVKSRGSLTSARPGGPSSLMEVVWNTGLVSSANAAVMGPLLSDTEYVILDTDYTDKALICSCRDLNMGFFAANRRSCAFLVRPTTDDVPVLLPEDYTELLDQVTPDLALDMKRVRQDDCGDLESRPSLDIGHWWSLARDYGQSVATMAAGWF